MLRCLPSVITPLILATIAVAFQTGAPDQRKLKPAGAPPAANPVPPLANTAVPSNASGGVAIPHVIALAHSEPTTTATANGTDNGPVHKYCGVLRGYSADRSALQLADRTDNARTAMGQQPCEHGEAVEIEVQGQALKDSLPNWKPGDRIIATVAASQNGAAELTTLRDIQPQLLEVDSWKPAVALFAFPVIIVVITIFSTGVRELLFVGQDGRWSNSKTQLSLWFTLWISAYAATFVLRWASPQHFLGSISTPSALLALSGISGLTFAGAKGITANKVANAPPVSANVVVPNGKRNNTKAVTSLADLVRDDTGNYDVGDFQMLLMTLIAVVSYAIIAYHFLGQLEARASVSLPDVDGTVLAMFGIGQGAYLAKKASTGIDQ